jgi:hypothetical protein
MRIADRGPAESSMTVKRNKSRAKETSGFYSVGIRFVWKHREARYPDNPVLLVLAALPFAVWAQHRNLNHTRSLVWSPNKSKKKKEKSFKKHVPTIDRLTVVEPWVRGITSISCSISLSCSEFVETNLEFIVRVLEQEGDRSA